MTVYNCQKDHNGCYESHDHASTINPVFVLPLWWNTLTSAFQIFTSVLNLFHEHFPSGWDNLHKSFYEHELSQAIKTTRFHEAMESIDGSLEMELKTRQINSFTRKEHYYISYCCKVLQAPQIHTAITCCGNAIQIQPQFGKSQLALLKRKFSKLKTVEMLRISISIGI